MPLFKKVEQEELERLVGKNPSASRWVALVSAEPKAGESKAELEAKELKYTGSKRIKTTAASWGAASGENPAVIENTEELKAGEWSAGADEKAKGFVIYDAEVEGNPVGFEKLEAEVTIGAGNKNASFAAKALKVKLA